MGDIRIRKENHKEDFYWLRADTEMNANSTKTDAAIIRGGIR